MNELIAIDRHISFSIEEEDNNQIALLDTLVTRNMLSSSMYTGKPPIPIDKRISSPTMTNDPRPVQVRLYYMVQLNSRAQNRGKWLN